MSLGQDTIYALSSGRPPAAIAVVRISGPRAGAALKALTGRVPEPRRAALARVRSPAGDDIDQAVALWFPGPHSETGEDVAELQLHGGRAVIAAVFAVLAELDGLRPAEAGEFTRRAFENGKLDLTEVEGLADLIGAETDAQRRLALRQLKGILGDRAESWRQRLIEAQALVAAPIDFADEGDMPGEMLQPAFAIVRSIAAEIAAALAGSGRSERLREGLIVAIAGPPNAGKSTLFNRIAGRDVAIVSPQAGTTRDVLEVHLDLGGLPVTLLDTAGIHESRDPVEMEGVRRAQTRAVDADLILWIADCNEPPDSARQFGFRQVSVRNRSVWLVLSKIDRHSRINEQLFNNEYIFTYCNWYGVSRETIYPLSALTGAGVDGLLLALQSYAASYFGGAETALVSRQRHRSALQATLDALNRALAPELADKEDLVAEELRLAGVALGRLIGRFDVEDVLTVIFRDFCIGK